MTCQRHASDVDTTKAMHTFIPHQRLQGITPTVLQLNQARALIRSQVVLHRLLTPRQTQLTECVRHQNLSSQSRKQLRRQSQQAALQIHAASIPTVRAQAARRRQGRAALVHVQRTKPQRPTQLGRKLKTRHRITSDPKQKVPTCSSAVSNEMSSKVWRFRVF